MHFLRDAIKAVPAVKYALGIGGILATVAIGRSFRTDLPGAAIETVVMLFLMSILVIFARMVSLTHRLRATAVVLTWFSLTLFMAVSCLIFSCVFFGMPRDLSSWLPGMPDANASSSVRASYTPYISEFDATLSINSSFDSVRGFFETELLRTRTTGSAEETAPYVSKLVDHYVAERFKYYTDQRVSMSHADAIEGKRGSGSQRKSLAAQCPANMTIEDHSVAIVTEEGTCLGPQILPNKTGATGVVSLTGAGRSACQLVMSCQYTTKFIAGAVTRERAALSNMARR
jgi:hypothetical protein